MPKNIVLNIGWSYSLKNISRGKPGENTRRKPVFCEKSDQRLPSMQFPALMIVLKVLVHTRKRGLIHSPWSEQELLHM